MYLLQIITRHKEKVPSGTILCRLMAGVRGIEPPSAVLETVVLPLYYTPSPRVKL